MPKVLCIAIPLGTRAAAEYQVAEENSRSAAEESSFWGAGIGPKSRARIIENTHTLCGKKSRGPGLAVGIPGKTFLDPHTQQWCGDCETALNQDDPRPKRP